jgi:hypothetical protein
MKFVTNGTWAIPLIPECRLTSIQDWAKLNKFQIQEDNFQSLDFIIPYRNSYARIIRAIAADLHEVMLDAGIVNLNKQTWDEVKSTALPFIKNWFDAVGHLPIKKNFCHTNYLINYLSDQLPENVVLVNVDNIARLPEYLKSKYGIEVTAIPELPEHFYSYTVPYGIIDELYNTNEKTKRLIDIWCSVDSKMNSRLLSDNLFISAQVLIP